MFKDFAIYGSANPDPAASYVETATALSSGHVGAAWTRHHVVYVPSAGTKYVSVGMTVASPATATPGSEHLASQYFDKWMLERVPTTQATPTATYSKAREVQVVVKADRINLMTNPSIAVGVTGWTTNAASATRDTTWRATGALKVTATVAANNDTNARQGGDTGGMRLGMEAGKTYTVSADINTPTALTGTLNNLARKIAIFYKVGAGGYQNVSSDAGPVTGTTRLSVTHTLPEGTTEAFVRFYNGSGVVGEYVLWDDILLEEVAAVHEYFDGSSGDNYLWEEGLTSSTGRSFYYENRLERTDAMTRAIQDAVPLGIGIGTPRFAVWTG